MTRVKKNGIFANCGHRSKRILSISIACCMADASDGQRLLTRTVLVRYACMCNDSIVCVYFFPSFVSSFSPIIKVFYRCPSITGGHSTDLQQRSTIGATAIHPDRNVEDNGWW